MSYAWDDEPGRVVHVKDRAMWSTLWEAFNDPDTHMVAHGAAFEFVVSLAATTPNKAWRKAIFAKLMLGRFRCTYVREKLLQIGLGGFFEEYGLDAVANRHCGIVLDKSSPWRLRYGTLFNTPVNQWPQEAIDYSLGDLAVRDVFKAQEAYGEEYFVNEIPQIQADVALRLSSCWGMVTDRAAADKLVEATNIDIQTARKTLFQAGLVDFKGKKETKKAQQYMVDLCERMGVDVARGEPTEKMKAKGQWQGNVKLDADACLATGDELLKAYTTYSQASTLLAKAQRYQKPLLQPGYNVLVNTGRTSSFQGNDPEPGQAFSVWGCQIQNPPRKEGVRECCIARPGHCLVSIDYNMAEVVSWAQACIDLLGYSDTQAILADPKRDVHVENGANVFDLDKAEVYAMKKAVEDARKALFKEIRQSGKVVVFGCPGGLGAGTLIGYARKGYGVILDQEKAEKAIAAWKKTDRAAGPYLDYISKQCGKRGGKFTLKQLRSGRIRGKVGYCDGANSYFQGLTADYAKAALVATMLEMYLKEDSLLFGTRMTAFVHDEELLEMPLDDKLHERAHFARDLWVSAAKTFVPDVALRAEPAAMLRWSKKAGDPVYDKNGRLVSWELRDK